MQCPYSKQRANIALYHPKFEISRCHLFFLDFVNSP